jgi:hypothetical protein
LSIAARLGAIGRITAQGGGFAIIIGADSLAVDFTNLVDGPVAGGAAAATVGI